MDSQDYKVKQEIMNGGPRLVWNSALLYQSSTNRKDHNTIASGSYEWENSLDNGIWTYSLPDVGWDCKLLTGNWPFR